MFFQGCGYLRIERRDIDHFLLDLVFYFIFLEVRKWVIFTICRLLLTLCISVIEMRMDVDLYLALDMTIKNLFRGMSVDDLRLYLEDRLLMNTLLAAYIIPHLKQTN